MFKKSVYATVLLIVALLCVHAFGSPPLFKPVEPPPQAFEVASIKPSTPGDRAKFATMQGGHQFVVRNYRVKDLVAFAYDLPPRLVSGGPAWADIDSYNILAAIPGETRPDRNAQMAMMRTLLVDRFKLAFHTEPKEFAVYALTIAKSGIKVQRKCEVRRTTTAGGYDLSS